jgi:hypothetical protein
MNETTGGNTTTAYTFPQTKQQIVQRLYDSKIITFDEMMILLDVGYSTTIVNPYPVVNPYPWQNPVMY